jgi:hypothetical protein
LRLHLGPDWSPLTTRVVAYLCDEGVLGLVDPVLEF